MVVVTVPKLCAYCMHTCMCVCSLCLQDHNLTWVNVNMHGYSDEMATSITYEFGVPYLVLLELIWLRLITRSVMNSKGSRF